MTLLFVRGGGTCLPACLLLQRLFFFYPSVSLLPFYLGFSFSSSFCVCWLSDSTLPTFTHTGIVSAGCFYRYGPLVRCRRRRVAWFHRRFFHNLLLLLRLINCVPCAPRTRHAGRSTVLLLPLVCSFGLVRCRCAALLVACVVLFAFPLHRSCRHVRCKGMVCVHLALAAAFCLPYNVY